MSSFKYGESSDVAKHLASASVAETKQAGVGVERLPASAGAGEERLQASAGVGEDRLPALAGAGKIWNWRDQDLQDLAISEFLQNLKFSMSGSSDPTVALMLRMMQQTDEKYHLHKEKRKVSSTQGDGRRSLDSRLYGK